MVALIIIAVLGIISYLIYADQPSTKFTKASKLLNQNRFQEAQVIFNQIVLKHPLAVTKYSECFFLQGEILQKENKTKEAINYYNEAIQAKSLLNPISDKKSYTNIEADAYYKICTIQFNELPKSNSLKTINAYKDNLNYIYRTGFGQLKRFSKLVTKHKLRIADIYYELGIKNEKEQNIINAKNNYSNTINTLKKIAKNQTYHNAISRSEICKLKFNENIDKDNFSTINKSSKAFQTDFYYRYSIHLIKHNEFSEAEKIIDEKLNNEYSKIQSLKEICLNEKIKLAVSEITNINSQIKNLYTISTPVEDILLLYNSISEKANDLNKIIPGVQKELESLKPSLFNRILHSYTEQKEFLKIINLIMGYPEFYKSPILLKNIGNSCVNYLINNTLTERNYKLFISMFLTSAYSDNVMLYSLEETSWDDEYTFSLADSIGSSYEIHSQLPVNVNYDEVTESNISIGESQRFLISQFESLLNGQDMDSSLSEKIHNFYDSEKKAIESIVSIIPNEIFFSTPYFAKMHKLEKEILSELEDDYNQYGNEDALSIGGLYNTNNSSSIISEFNLAKEILDNILSSIKTINKSSFEEYTTKKNIGIIKKYSSIFDDAEIKMAEVIDTVSEKNSENENLLNLMRNVIKIFPTNDKLTYQYTNFVIKFCVQKVFRSKSLENYKALRFLSDAYLLNRNNHKLCENLVLFINNNLFDLINGSSNHNYEIYSILDTIKYNRSKTFIHHANMLAVARKKVINQLSPDDLSAINDGINLTPSGKTMKQALDIMLSLAIDEDLLDDMHNFLNFQ